MHVGNWNAAALCAVHATISASDALTSNFFHRRCKGSDHEEVSILLRALPIPNADDLAKQAIRILKAKDVVEYEDRLFQREEATAVVARCERFLDCARAVLAPKV